MEDSDEEDYTFFGTPLTPYDEDDVPRKKPLRPEDQIATDKQGRRRFHGAFTGGFSAGFYNSVGTPEGWTPTAFKSSRVTKADQREQRPEDFMDDEDTDEFGIAPSVLRAKPEYGGGANKRKQEKISFNVGPIPGEPVLRSILEPAKQTIGVLLLMKMGWKPGQGIGPLLTRLQKKMKKEKKKRENEPVKVYGCARGPPEDGGSSESDYDDVPDEINVKALFAPDDVETTFTKPKVDKFGMGYSGLDKNHQILSQTRFELFEKEKDTFRMLDNNKKLAIKGQAFGVGAFEEDDEDIYARDDMTRYDFALESAEALRQKRKQEREKARLLAIAEAASGIVSGFVPAKKTPPRRKFFPRPQIPADFQPYHSTRKTRFGPEHPHILELGLNRQREAKKQVITAVDRAAMLGEEKNTRDKTLKPLPTKPEDKTVTPLPTKPEEVKAKEPEIEQQDSEMMQRLEEDFKKSKQLEEEAATEGQMNDNFRPFMSDPPKQARYERYLHFVKIGAKDAFPAIQPRSMSLWEKDRELAEFEQAAKLYRPLSGMMADRFSRAELPDDVNNPLAPVARSLPSADADMIAAARRKTFGKATRRSCEWVPVTLLCKRMNIPEPVTSGGPSLSQVAQDRNTTKAKPKFGVFDFLAEPQSTDKFRKLVLNKREPEDKLVKVIEEKQLKENKIESIPLPVSEPAPPSPADEPMEQPKNVAPSDFEDPAEKRDLFKAIFCSSEEEDNDEDGDKPTEPSTPVPKTTPSSSLSTTNALRNTSPPRGIFANLDLDKLANRKKTETEEGKTAVKTETTSEEPVVDLYGPPLPNKPVFLPKKVATKPRKQSTSSSSSSDDEWIEKEVTDKGSDDRKKKKKKKKHKKYEKKKDKKKKKKSKK